MKPALTLEAFADWCEKQPAEKKYDYCNHCSCAYAQFLQANGYPEARVVTNGWRVSSKTEVYSRLPASVDDAVCEHPWEFGALATRLRTAIAAQAA